jgi:uncharacterized protein (DUF433 family)
MQQYAQRITVDPGILVGKPVIKGTRVPVQLVLKRLSQDLDAQTLLESYDITADDVKACLAYAEAVVAGEDVYPYEETTNAHQVGQTV